MKEFNQEALLASIQAGLKGSVDTAIDHVVESAKEEIEKRIRAEATRYALNLATWFEIERIGPTLRIEIKETKEPPMKQ